MRGLRRAHTYLGLFFAPLLLFFIASGGYQVLDRDRLKDPSEAESLIQKLRVVHTDQIYPKTGARKQPSSTPFRALTVVLSVAIVATTVLGVILAFRALKPWWLVWLTLLGGVMVPILFLLLSPTSG